MGATLIAPPEELELPLSDRDIGSGGQPPEPGDEPHGRPEHDPDRRDTPLSAYRVLVFWIIVSIVMLFSMLTAVLESRWVNADDWVSIRLPRIFYLNTAILLLSSLTIELAQRSLRSKNIRNCARWIAATLLLGLAFVGGQIVAWQELVARGLYLASNPGSCFIYIITGAHGVHLLGGITLLALVALFLRRWSPNARETGVAVVAAYWHFMDGLWCYLLVLLFITVQR